MHTKDTSVISPDYSDQRTQKYTEHIQVEFGTDIPWISDSAALESAHPFLLTKESQLLGGILMFPDAVPETQKIVLEKVSLVDPEGTFLSCLYITPQHRGHGLATHLLQTVLQKKVFSQEQYGWGIASDQSLLPYYEKHFEVKVYPIQNNLTLIIFPHNT